MARPSILSVVIPTYQRPDWIRRAIGSLAGQARPPDEVIAVARDTDVATHESIAALQAQGQPFKLRRELVSEPGFIPPVRAGIAAATGDIIAVMDDDAEAVDGWAARLLDNYDGDDGIGAVGGRCINTSDETGPTPVPETNRVGYVNGVGQFIGRMYYRPTFNRPTEVDFLMGGNMSFRREVAARLEFDMQLNRNVAQGYEVDLGLQVRRLGWKIMFDPLLAIRHYSAPRATAGLRAYAAESIQWYAFNQLRVGLRRLPRARGSISLVYQFLVGERPAPGVLPFVLSPIARRLGFETQHAPAALKGRVLAARSVFAPARIPS